MSALTPVNNMIHGSIFIPNCLFSDYIKPSVSKDTNALNLLSWVDRGGFWQHEVTVLNMFDFFFLLQMELSPPPPSFFLIRTHLKDYYVQKPLLPLPVGGAVESDLEPGDNWREDVKGGRSAFSRPSEGTPQGGEREGQLRRGGGGVCAVKEQVGSWKRDKECVCADQRSVGEPETVSIHWSNDGPTSERHWLTLHSAN